MSDATNDAADPVRFVPVEPSYPRQRLLAEVPEGHMVHCETDERLVVTRKGELCSTLLYSSGKHVLWRNSRTVTDHGPVEGMFPHAAGGWRFTLAQTPVPETVLLGSLAPLDVVRFPNHQIGVILYRQATGALFVKVGDAYRDSDRNTLVTLLGSIRFGGVA